MKRKCKKKEVKRGIKTVRRSDEISAGEME